MHGLAQNVEFRVVGAAVAAGAAIDDNSTRIDMANYESVTFVAPITTRMHSASGSIRAWR